MVCLLVGTIAGAIKVVSPLCNETPVGVQWNMGSCNGTWGQKKTRHNGRVKAKLATTYSPTLLSAVPSAMKGLTSEFGMGSGISPSPLSPENISCSSFSQNFIRSMLKEPLKQKKGGQAYGLLVLVSYTHYCAYTPSLSTM